MQASTMLTQVLTPRLTQQSDLESNLQRNFQLTLQLMLELTNPCLLLLAKEPARQPDDSHAASIHLEAVPIGKVC